MRPKIQKKAKEVDSLAKKLEESKVIGILDLTNLPSAQFQAIRAKIKGKFNIRVAKKPLIKLALEKIKNKKKDIIKLEESLKDIIPALVFTDEGPFKMSKIFQQNKSKSFAKPGHISPQDITIDAGPTSFSPGPIIGELGQAGIKAAVEQGKIVIKEAKLVVEKGQEITQPQADLLAKFDIKPIEIGLNLVTAYEDGYVYNREVLSIDEKKYIEDIQIAHSEAFNLAMFIAYPTKETTMLLLQKAQAEINSLSKLMPKEETQQPKKEEPKEELKEEPKEEVKKEETQKQEKTPKPSINMAEYTEEASKQAQEVINQLKDSKSGG